MSQFKIPEDYNFSNQGINWKDYQKHYILRTDAIWEKFQLRDWFRLYMRPFYFNAAIKNYELIEPEDIQSLIFEGWNLEDWETHRGFTPTGRTNCFQVALPPRSQIQTSQATQQLHEDYYEMCGLRFEKYHKCDMAFYDDRHKYDYKEKDFMNYPCFREYYEAQFSCTDEVMEFLMELNFQNKVSGTFQVIFQKKEDYANWELQTQSTVYDVPKGGERKTYTY